VVWASPHQAYVGSERDRELISLSIEGDAIKVRKRIAVPGRPVALITSKSGARLFAALSSVGEVVVLDTAEDRLIERFSVLAPPSVYSNESRLGGVNSNALALTPDGRTLLVSNGGQNSIAVVKLSSYAMEGHARNGVSTAKRPAARDASPGGSVVVGLVPTGWYPTGVATSSDGRYWYIVNGKSPPGPIAEGIQFRLQKGGFLRIPAPGVEELTRLTRQVARNNGFDRPAPLPAEEHLFAFLRAHIKHVIYITKENRSYDQVLGDLEGGNGDARFAAFPERITPNHHALARYFVTLDHYVASAEGSWTGEQWCLAAGATDFTERHDPLSLAGRKVEYAYANTNRFRNMAYPNNVLRKESYVSAPADDPDTLVGAADVAAPDGPGGEEGGGYLWDAAIRAGLSVRNYGMFLYYPSTLSAPLVRDPFAEKIRVAYSGNAALIPHTSPYFRGYDERFPDFWRVQEWKREFDQYVAQGNLPGLTLMTLPADHFGSFDEAIDGLNTQQRQMADNDYALGQVVEAVANSPFADSTLIIAVEDGPFGSPDHVEASRAPLFFAGPYVRRGSVISSRYTTPDLLKTIEAILGLAPLQLNDALAAPMSEIFDPKASAWSYEAIVPDILRTTQLPLPPPASKSTH
jgi:DNA-binding beta-propeller fold protein YncE